MMRIGSLSLAAAITLGACGSSWMDISRAVALEPAPDREPVRDRLRSYYDREATRPRSEVNVLILPDGRQLNDGVERKWFPDGRLEFERNWRAGEAEGWWRTWWPDGSPRFEHRYQSGEATTMRWWHRGGALSTEGLARQGLREGPWRGWHPGGTPAFEGAFRSGRREGIWTFWHPDGSLAERGEYRDERRFGIWDELPPGERPGAAPRWDEPQ